MRIIYKNPKFAYMDKQYMYKNNMRISNKYICKQNEDIEKLEQYQELINMLR